MVDTPQDYEEVPMPDPKKHKPPDGEVRTSLEALPLDNKPPSGGCMSCVHAPSASTAAGAMTSPAATGYSTPEAAEDASLEQDPEPLEPQGNFEGGRTVSGNIQCECCEEYGLWSQFAFAELGDGFDWKAANIHNQKLAEVVTLVKREKGGRVHEVPEEQFNNGKVVLACYRCWVRATGETGYMDEQTGKVTRMFRNMAQRTKPSDSDNNTKRWLQWR
eukprot:6478998-Amphidinium_carterae.2